MSPWIRLRSTRGSALVTAVVISVLTLALVVIYQETTLQGAKDSVHRLESQRALSYADSAISQAMDWLRLPQAGSNPAAGQSYTLANPAPVVNGSANVTMSRDPNDATLVTATATGYYDLADGTDIDPLTNQAAQSAVIQATLRVHAIADYFAVVPTTLQIDFGSDLSSASVYAHDLVFLSSTTGTSLTTKIGSAYYFNTVTPNPAPFFVTFSTTPYQAQQLTSEPNLITLNSVLRGYYQAWAGADVLPPGDQLIDDLTPPVNAYSVYFCNGDLNIGDSSHALNVKTPTIIYVTGQVNILNSITVTSSGWLVILAEGSVDVKAGAPTTLNINATLITNGQLYGELRSGPGNLTLTGGFQAQGGANLGTAWPQRTYIYHAAPSSLILPFFLDIESYKVLKGKFYHG